jgi:hypothetical protein
VVHYYSVDSAQGNDKSEGVKSAVNHSRAVRLIRIALSAARARVNRKLWALREDVELQIHPELQYFFRQWPG